MRNRHLWKGLSLIAILAILVFSSCKKEEVVEEPEVYPEYVQLNFKNSDNSEHYINVIESRIMKPSGEHIDENWSENIMLLGQNIAPGDSLNLYIVMEREYICEFRFGVITNVGEVVLIYEQEGWSTPIHPFFSRGNHDLVDFSISATTGYDSGIIYMHSWQ